jgi:hypothetical protein
MAADMILPEAVILSRYDSAWEQRAGGHPRRLRDVTGLTPGAAVAFEERPDGVLVKAERRNHRLRGRYRGSGMAQQLLEDRGAEPE